MLTSANLLKAALWAGSLLRMSRGKPVELWKRVQPRSFRRNSSSALGYLTKKRADNLS